MSRQSLDGSIARKEESQRLVTIAGDIDGLAEIDPAEAWEYEPALIQSVLLPSHGREERGSGVPRSS